MIETTDIRFIRNAMVPMRDGVHLATDIYLPADGAALPVLLERTPYDKDGTNHADFSAADPTPRSKPEIARLFAAHGYAFVSQDCRGRYGSEGTFRKYMSEAEDGADTIAWIMEQPWCNGRIGTLGLSYGAHVQAALATLDPHGLAAMFLDSGGFSSAYHSGIRQGGAYELKQLTWALKHALLARETASDPARRAALEAVDIREWIGVEKWRPGHSPISAAPEYEDFILEQWSEDRFTDFWKQRGLYARGWYDAFADVPMVHMSSWYDPYALTAIENFTGLSARKQSPVKLIMGPWTHGKRSLTYSGDADFGPQSTLDHLFGDYVALRQRWFDHHLKGAGPDPLPEPVYLFTMGGGSGRRLPSGRLDHGGRWRSAAGWPLAAMRMTPFHLHMDGGLGENPVSGAGARSFVHDPHHPVPTIGGAIASGAPVMEAGGFDQREGPDFFGSREAGRALADRPDVLIFETPPLDTDVELTGQAIADLFVSSTAADTDVMIKVVDVYPPSADYPDGYALNIAHGLLRMRFRNAFEEPEIMEPGKVYRVQIVSFPMSNRFAMGHRIRVEIAGSNFPHFDINPNTDWQVEGLAPATAETSIHLGPDRPSYILLPVVPIEIA
ncbi:MAG: CocE/NonD family hydrolase [Sphingopyxis sp.]|uniref:CocE/NonD family hydrolase n=1 Tax=Sphingopyxis sp. TaxID=1908224 RepID=UPI001A52818B|nr:CocE/NonD family hydrolase [Sphingopyxis sp.]MBL9071381.1 CocE/NonD family hydrolase [Sphingopyxis sp.]